MTSAVSAPRDERSTEEPASPLPGGDSYATAAAALVLTVVALGLLLLFPYLTRGWRYPLGWDAPSSVRRTEAVGFDGLEHIGAIRAGAPLLFATLVQATRQNSYTLVAIGPTIVAAVGAMGAGAMARAALGIRWWWVPTIGFLSWAAFGPNPMLDLHLDNLVNSALVLAGLAALISFAAWRKGLLATTALFMAAGLAHYPFWGVAMVAVVLALGAMLLPPPAGMGRPALRSIVLPALVPVAASGALVGLTFLAIPGSGWLGLRLADLRSLLRRRFMARLRGGNWHYAVPFALAGAVVGTRLRVSPERRMAYRLFVWILLAWALVTLGAGIAQWANVPTAGARLLMFLFPITIFTGLFVWWLAGRLGGWGRRGRVAAVLVVLAFLSGFAGLTARGRGRQHSSVKPEMVEQVTASGAYIATLPPDQRIVFVLGRTSRGRPAIQIVRATLPADQAVRAYQYFGLYSDYLAGAPQKHGSAALPQPATRRTGIMLQAFAPEGFQSARRQLPDREVAPGVLTLDGPVPARPLAPGDAPVGNTGLPGLVVVSGWMLAVLLVAGGGWSLALLPADPVVRVALAPALGMASLMLPALAWDRMGLPLSGAWPLLPSAVTTGAGWLWAARTRVASRG